MEKVEINWTIPALQMLHKIYDYISLNSVKNAANYINDIYEFVSKLEKHPEFCSFCKYTKLKIKEFRCCNFKSHVIIYENISKSELNILAVIHQKRSPNFFNKI